jgi:hypothetical protein
MRSISTLQRADSNSEPLNSTRAVRALCGAAADDEVGVRSAGRRVAHPSTSLWIGNGMKVAHRLTTAMSEFSMSQVCKVTPSSRSCCFSTFPVALRGSSRRNST